MCAVRWVVTTGLTAFLFVPLLMELGSDHNGHYYKHAAPNGAVLWGPCPIPLETAANPSLLRKCRHPSTFHRSSRHTPWSYPICCASHQQLPPITPVRAAQRRRYWLACAWCVASVWLVSLMWIRSHIRDTSHTLATHQPHDSPMGARWSGEARNGTSRPGAIAQRALVVRAFASGWFSSQAWRTSTASVWVSPTPKRRL